MFFEVDYMKYCRYFQAHVARPRVWFFTATLRSFEHLCFDRTLDKTESLFEFFVPEAQVDQFLGLMDWYQTQKIILSFQECSNRISSPKATL
jgi:hypothetical protein